jgi:hypothetical protein
MSAAGQPSLLYQIAPDASPVDGTINEVPSDPPTPTASSAPTDTPEPTDVPVHIDTSTAIPSSPPPVEATDAASPTEIPDLLPAETPTATPVATALADSVVLSNAPIAEEETISLTVAQGASIDFGTVPPEQGSPDGLGTGSYYYTAGDGAVRIVVTSDSPSWSGTCQVTTDNGGAGASSMTVANGALAWRINDPSSADDAGWTEFVTDSADGACIPSPPDTLAGPPYSYTYAYDYRLHVTWADTPGNFRVVVTYAVTLSH